MTIALYVKSSETKIYVQENIITSVLSYVAGGSWPVPNEVIVLQSVFIYFLGFLAVAGFLMYCFCFYFIYRCTEYRMNIKLLVMHVALALS